MSAEDALAAGLKPTSGGLPASTIPAAAAKRGGRRIELRAVDSPRERRENSEKSEIETYHAR
jgi:hypothetical protein